VFGDSQGDTGPTYHALQDALDKHKIKATVINKSVGGTLACGWAQDPKAIVKAAKEAFPFSSPDLVWYTAGANDLAADKQYHSCLENAKNDDDAAACIAQSNSILMNCTETLLEHLWEAFPKASVGQYNYDAGCFDGDCTEACEEFLGGAYCQKSSDPKTCLGKALQYWQTVYVDALQQKYAMPQYVGMNILGTVQMAAGIKGAAVGTLVLGQGAKCDWTVSCVHTKYGTPAAAAIGEAMYDLWVSKVIAPAPALNQTSA
jgi:hypothetical protein